MSNYTPTVEETAQAVAAAKASPIFAAAYDAVFEHRRAMTREEALKAAYDRYKAADNDWKAANKIYVVAFNAYRAELARIDKEYPQ